MLSRHGGQPTKSFSFAQAATRLDANAAAKGGQGGFGPMGFPILFVYLRIWYLNRERVDTETWHLDGQDGPLPCDGSCRTHNRRGNRRRALLLDLLVLFGVRASNCRYIGGGVLRMRERY
ncbi:hypothetical protein SAMN05445871_5126 [Paraburkholderia caballeronis]|nr:hypothetical protein C7403_105302 [Paraburkholderia caballeronis]PXX01226.1 hypothetical protein C7407_105301 [Paraburkholderia caballeronis]RAJ99421.1 hypothetical protein C7409_105150 [Paraburkholderia caballeronis]SEE29973.1 hypothetical protein SAMN05445871_5126 [Paraburkholderia caballeronis]